MTLEILTPEKKLYSGEASAVTLPGIDGKFQLLERHAPIISALGKGKLVYKSATGVNEIEILSSRSGSWTYRSYDYSRIAFRAENNRND